MPAFDFPLGGQLPLDRCPHCGVARPTISHRWGPQRSTTHDDLRERHWSAYECTTCGGMVLAGTRHGRSGQVSELYPMAREPDTDLPSRAQHFLGEAIEIINSPSSAIMAAASAVDAMLKAKDYTEGSLYSRIDRAADDGVITEDMAHWAHDVRLDANDQRHADEDAELPEISDAERCVEFAEALGEFLFVLPARVRRGRENASEETE